jgi:hypothetical protein
MAVMIGSGAHARGTFVMTCSFRGKLDVGDEREGK